MPKSTGHLHLTTAGKLHSEAKAKEAVAQDREWDEPSEDNFRIANFWGAERAKYASMEASTVIPLF